MKHSSSLVIFALKSAFSDTFPKNELAEKNLSAHNCGGLESKMRFPTYGRGKGSCAFLETSLLGWQMSPHLVVLNMCAQFSLNSRVLVSSHHIGLGLILMALLQMYELIKSSILKSCHIVGLNV